MKDFFDMMVWDEITDFLNSVKTDVPKQKTVFNKMAVFSHHLVNLSGMFLLYSIIIGGVVYLTGCALYGIYLLGTSAPILAVILVIIILILILSMFGNSLATKK